MGLKNVLSDNQDNLSLIDNVSLNEFKQQLDEQHDTTYDNLYNELLDPKSSRLF